MTGKRILMVDDDEALRASLAEQLQLHEEFETTTAGTAAEALEIIKQDYFDVVLLDVGLPDMDGRECCRLMRRSGMKAPVIMLTAHDTDADTISGAGRRRERLCHQTVPARRPAGAGPRPASPARTERGRGIFRRTLYLPPVRQDAGRRRA